MPKADENEVIDLSHLTVQRDGEHYTIGNPGIPRFIRVPEPAVFVVELADGTRTVAEIKRRIAEEKGLDLDVADFASDLAELGLLGRSSHDADRPRPKKRELLATRIGAALFRSHAKWAYLLALAAVIGMVLNDPDLFPSYRDMFVLPVIGTNSLLVSATACLLIFLHECAHLLAAYGAGVSARMRLNIRFVFVVAETDMTGLWGKEKSARYFPYLAGMAWDSAVLLAAMLAQSVLPEGGFAHAMARLIALLLLLGLLSQFMVFLRTDVYYVIGNAAHSADLAGSGRLFLCKLWKRDEAAHAGWASLPRSERTAGRWFAAAYFAGIGTVACLFIVYSIPAGYYAITQAIGQVTRGSLDGPFWDGAVLLSLAALRLALYVIGAGTALKDRRNRKRAFRQA
jgi:hypothetical protein